MSLNFIIYLLFNYLYFKVPFLLLKLCKEFEIKVILNEMDRLKKEREEIILRNNGSVSKDEDLKQITIIDSEIDELKQSLKVLKVKTK